ncbi:UDP-N-acetylglucosamine 2-epimerase [Alphaproteobacteria bacterium]|nr:UDP-N-acetylglucosamine 2-epimerase [Alphaproteobacteria bacterium]
MISIAVLTGKRGGYGAMRPMLKIFEKSKIIDLYIIATDQHLNKKFGFTINEIKKDFKKIIEVPIFQKSDSDLSRSTALGNCVIGLSKKLVEINPDYLMLYGDRGEVLAAALVSTHLKIPIAHMQGGDISGNIDDGIRHAVSKLSHLHFVSNKNSFNRLRKMGEERWRIKNVGDSHIDPILTRNKIVTKNFMKKYNITNDNKPIIALLHPETIRKRDTFRDAKLMLECIKLYNRHTIIIYPCTDNGYEKIINAIKCFKNVNFFKVYKNIDSADFIKLLSISSLLIGNSSSGIIEAEYFNLPVINIGKRQLNRIRNKNVIDVDFNKLQVVKKIDYALNNKNFHKEIRRLKQLYGEGDTGLKIYNHLISSKYDKKKLLYKKFI